MTHYMYMYYQVGRELAYWMDGSWGGEMLIFLSYQLYRQLLANSQSSEVIGLTLLHLFDLLSPSVTPLPGCTHMYVDLCVWS